MIISGKRKILFGGNNDSSEEILLPDIVISCQHCKIILKYAGNVPYHLKWSSDVHSIIDRRGDWYLKSHNDTQEKSQKIWGRK